MKMDKQTLYIGPITYEIEEVDNIEYGDNYICLGLCDDVKQVIYIRKDAKVDGKKSTILHEILHSLSDVYAIGLKERQVQQLSTALIQFINDNYDFYQEWETMDITQDIIEGVEKEFAIYHSKKDDKELN